MQAATYTESNNSQPMVIGIGLPYPAELPRAGVLAQFSSLGISLLFALPEPSQKEKAQFDREHPVKIGIAKFDRIGVLIIDFGEGISIDTPFDAGVENPVDVSDLSGITDQSQLTFFMIGIDTSDGNKVFGLRSVTASKRVSREFFKRVIDQVANPVDHHVYL
jgi:hypothetical protein